MLTAARERCLRAILAFLRQYRRPCPTYRALRAAAPCCNDVVSATLQLLEQLGIAEVIRARRGSGPMMAPNRIRFRTDLPSRRDQQACLAWEEQMASRYLPALSAAQDYAILAAAWGMACFAHYLRRWRDHVAAISRQAEERRRAAVEEATRRRAESEAGRGFQPASRSDFRRETKSNDHSKGAPAAPPLSHQERVNRQLMKERERRRKEYWAKSNPPRR
jgi:hypothetical protein